MIPALAVLPWGRILAIGAILAALGAAVGYHVVRVYSLQAEIAQAKGGKAQAEGDLARRIGAEATVVAAAVQKARTEEQAAFQRLQKDYDELKQARDADGVALNDARGRLYDSAKKRAATCPGGGNVRQATAVAGGAATAAPDGLPGADRALIDELLQLGAEANEAARQRNLAVRQYQVNCAK